MWNGYPETENIFISFFHNFSVCCCRNTVDVPAVGQPFSNLVNNNNNNNYDYYYGSTALCWALAAFSVSLSYTQSVGLLGRGSACRKAATYTQNKRTQTFMPWMGFEPTTPVFERPKTVHALDRAATVIGSLAKHTLVQLLSSSCNSNLPRFTSMPPRIAPRES
jgi:hypothetical protein